MADGEVYAKVVRAHQKKLTKGLSTNWVFVFVPNDSDIGDYQSLLEALAPQKRRKPFAHAARVVSILIALARVVL